MYDCIIIGGGIAGLTAGIYTARAGLKTVVLEKEQTGGQALFADKIENYPGFLGSGAELMEKVEEQAVNAGAEIVYDTVEKVSLAGETKIIYGEENEYRSKTVIIALGASHKKAGFEGEDEYAGRGVSYCAVCDGAFFKNKRAAVIGGANTAVSEALYLADICEKVYLVYRRDKLRAEDVLVKRLEQKENVQIIYNSVPLSVTGEKSVQKLTVTSGELEVSGVFVAAGIRPETEFLKDELKLDSDGFIIAHGSKTDIPGVFAAGDCRKKGLRQLVTAAADGAVCADLVKEYTDRT